MTPFLNTLAQAAGAQQPGGVTMFIPFILILGIFYFLVLRPQAKQEEAKKQMQGSLKKGDEILLKGGIHGKVFEVKTDILLIEIADKVRIKVNRDAVAGLKDGSEPQKES